MNARGKQLAIAAAVVVAAVLALGVVGPGLGLLSGETHRITVGNATVDPGETATAEITLQTVPEGFSGYDFEVSVADASVATISNATANDGPGLMTGSPEISGDGESVRLLAADTRNDVSAGSGPVVLGTVTVEGGSAGHTCLELSDEAVTDAQGNSVNTEVVGGSVTVGDASGSC